MSICHAKRSGGRFLAGLAVLILTIAGGASADEFRAFWADAWHDGFTDSGQVTTMVNTAKDHNFNTIVMEVRKRGDAYYFPTYPNTEPRDSDLASNYDPLADVITQAHAKGLRVVAWIVANAIAGDPPPTTSTHVYKAHPEWLMKDSSGNKLISSAYWLDPGVPEAMTWNYNVAMDLIQHYNIDGLSFDYIRYPNQDSGYNDIALQRYYLETGTTTKPAPSDPVFSAWRRRQVTDFLKKVYANAMAIKPNLAISASTFSNRSDAFNYRFQNWGGSTEEPGWMEKGYLDANLPMNYSNDNTVFNSRTDDAYSHRYGRHVYIGQGAGSNTVSNTLTQLLYVRSKGCDGMCTYSYQGTNSEQAADSYFYDQVLNNVFQSPASVPTMSWKLNPTQGILKGVVTRSGTGTPIYNAQISVNGQSDLCDATGFYAFMKMNPGIYIATCKASGYLTSTVSVTISAGMVTTADLALVPDSLAPVIHNVQVSEVYANSATITWTTDEASTSRVEFGPSTAYGNQSELNTALVTTHSLLLAGLTPSTTYHFRAKSLDGVGNEGASGDFSFTTASPNTVSDIIIDNGEAGFMQSGSWTKSSSSTDKYGPDYIYCTGLVGGSDTRYVTWTPTIVTEGDYKVYVWYPAGSNRTTGALYKAYYPGGNQTFIIDQTGNGGRWNLLGQFHFVPGGSGYVRLGNGTASSGTNVMADAARWEFVPHLTPPVISGINTSGITQTQATITWTTDEPATSQVEYGTSSSYGQSSATDSNKVLNHSATLSGLSVGTAYHFRIKSADAFANLAISADSSFATLPETDPPIISNITARDANTNSATIEWETNEISDSQVEYGPTISYGHTSSLDAQLVTLHSIPLSGLQPGVIYHYRVKSRDAVGNLAVSTDQLFYTGATQTYETTGGFVKQGRWNLISIPADPVNADPLSVFSGVDVANSNLQYWRNNVDGGGYITYGANDNWYGPIARGVPYWFMESGGGPDKDLHFLGIPPISDFELAISGHSSAPFWVMLGTPFIDAVPASNLRFKNTSKRGDAWLTWGEAFSESDPSLRIVDSNIQGWLAAENRFITVVPPPWMGESDRLNPWWGYWLLVYDSGELRIKVPKP